jgi:hypothetical protein
VLKLVEKLSPEEYEQVFEEMKLQDLRQDILKAADEADNGELIPGDVVLAELTKRYES